MPGNGRLSVKRFLDIAMAVCGLLICGPLFLFAAFLVRIKLGSPVLFKQERPGLFGRPFVLYKFRTMAEEMDRDGQPLPDSRRLTPTGKFLRKCSLDELPQLYNILKGDMSFVGPRPLLTKYLPHYTSREQMRHHVRPGITGLAQISGRNMLSWDERLELDVRYVENQSVLMDLKILFLTPLKVLKQQDVVIDPTSSMLDLDQLRMTPQQHMHIGI